MNTATADLSAAKADASALFKRKQIFAFAFPAVVLVYLTYIFFAFDILGLAQRANWDNAVTLASDSWSYKEHVTRSNRTGEMDYAVEGERKGRWPEGERPDWVTGDEIITIDLGREHFVRLLPENRTEVEIPGFGLIEASVDGRRVITNLGEDIPDWINAGDRRVSITTPEGRITLTGTKTEVFNYFTGWELFWFTHASPYWGHGIGEVLFGDRIDPERANISGGDP